MGFDDNVSMLRKGFKGTGSSVAIPAWIAQARAVAEVDAFADRIDLLDLDIQATGQVPLFNRTNTPSSWLQTHGPAHSGGR